MLAAYLDASGVTKSEKHFVMAGFVAPTDKWVEFERDWTELLTLPRYSNLLPERNGKKYAHAKKIAGWKKELREFFFTEANYLIKRAALFAVAITYKHSDYKSAYEGYPLTKKDGPYGFGFRCTLVACCKNINEKHENQPISFIVEQGDPGQGGAENIFNQT